MLRPARLSKKLRPLRRSKKTSNGSYIKVSETVINKKIVLLLLGLILVSQKKDRKISGPK